jgi:RNA polymerase sigma-70 factor (ECF subfamily)
MSMPPVPSWYQGAKAIGAWLQSTVLPPDAAGRYRFVRTRANGSPAVAVYARHDGVDALLGVHVLEIADGSVRAITAFMDPATWRFFELTPPG